MEKKAENRAARMDGAQKGVGIEKIAKKSALENATLGLENRNLRWSSGESTRLHRSSCGNVLVGRGYVSERVACFTSVLHGIIV